MLPNVPAGPEKRMLEGCVLFFTKPESAKDALSEALRLLPDGETRQKAQVWLASSYWAIGEVKEARILIRAFEPVSDAVRFIVGLNSSIYETSKYKRSLAYLTAIQNLVDQVLPLWRGKFFLQRGWLMRRLGKIDAAILDYESARFWFQEAESSRYVAAAVNNLAGLLSDANRFSDAHAALDSAINLLSPSDVLYQAQIYDQKAQTYNAEGAYRKGIQCAERAVALLSASENAAVFVESLITYAESLTGAGEHAKAISELERAREVSKYLGNQQLLVRATKEERKAAEKLGQLAHFETVQLALALSPDSLRGAARLVGCSVQALDRFIKLHKIEYHPKVRKSIITKPHK